MSTGFHFDEVLPHSYLWSVFFSVLPQSPQDGQLAVALAFTLTSMTHLELTSVRGVHRGGQALCAVFQSGLLSPLRSRKNRVTTPHPPNPKKKKSVGIAIGIVLTDLGKTDILKIIY